MSTYEFAYFSSMRVNARISYQSDPGTLPTEGLVSTLPPGPEYYGDLPHDVDKEAKVLRGVQTAPSRQREARITVMFRGW